MWVYRGIEAENHQELWMGKNPVEIKLPWSISLFKNYTYWWLTCRVMFFYLIIRRLHWQGTHKGTQTTCLFVLLDWTRSKHPLAWCTVLPIKVDANMLYITVAVETDPTLNLTGVTGGGWSCNIKDVTRATAAWKTSVHVETDPGALDTVVVIIICHPPRTPFQFWANYRLYSTNRPTGTSKNAVVSSNNADIFNQTRHSCCLFAAGIINKNELMCLNTLRLYWPDRTDGGQIRGGSPLHRLGCCVKRHGWQRPGPPEQQ